MHYVHGYSGREETRLLDQATALAELLHAGTRYPSGSRVLEAGCGVGAQTVALARDSPRALFTAIDIAADSLRTAASRVADAGIDNVVFLQADLLDLPFPAASFDHVFVSFVLEHLRDPGRALEELRRRLRPGGTLTVIEGDHGSTLLHPDGARARRAIECLVELQARAGGDALVGRRLFPLLTGAGFQRVTVVPRPVYADASRPLWVDHFTRRTFTAMVEGVRDDVLAQGLMAPLAWREAIEELHRTAGPDGVLVYTFFKAVGVAP